MGFLDWFRSKISAQVEGNIIKEQRCLSDQVASFVIYNNLMYKLKIFFL